MNMNRYEDLALRVATGLITKGFDNCSTVPQLTQYVMTQFTDKPKKKGFNCNDGAQSTCSTLSMYCGFSAVDVAAFYFGICGIIPAFIPKPLVLQTRRKDYVQLFVAENKWNNGLDVWCKCRFAEQARTAALLFVWAGTKHYTFRGVNKDIAKLIGKFIYATRFDAAWAKCAWTELWGERDSSTKRAVKKPKISQ